MPYGDNPRVIPDSAIDTVAESIKRFGFRQPIVVDQGDVIVIGHVRQLAALKLGLTSVPVHVVADLSVEQAKGLRIVDNRTSEMTEWDADLLEEELERLGSEVHGLEEILSRPPLRHTPAGITPKIVFGDIKLPWGAREDAWMTAMEETYGTGSELRQELEKRLLS